MSGFVHLVEHGHGVTTGDPVACTELLGQVGTVSGLGQVLHRLGLDDAPSPAQAAGAVEFVLEGLHLTRRLAKDMLDDGRIVYGDAATGGSGTGSGHR